MDPDEGILHHEEGVDFMSLTLSFPLWRLAHFSQQLRYEAQSVRYGHPHSIRTAEISTEGKSIYAHDPKGEVVEAYRVLIKGILKIEKQRQKYEADIGR